MQAVEGGQDFERTTSQVEKGEDQDKGTRGVGRREQVRKRRDRKMGASLLRKRQGGTHPTFREKKLP